MLLRSYRSRLIFYSIILMVFLSGTLIYSYGYVQNVIRTEADAHLSRIIQLLNSHLSNERNELKRYASIVADDLRFKEYMFVVAKIGSDSKPLEELYDRHFGWLPVDHRIIIGENGSVFVGTEYVGLARALANRKNKYTEDIFYYQGEQGLEIVSVVPIHYRHSLLGHVAVARLMDNEWLEQLQSSTDSHFFIAEDGLVLVSTIPNHLDGRYDPKDSEVLIGSEIYHVAQVDLPGVEANGVKLWFAHSETALNERLQQHQNITFFLVVAGLIAIIVMGLIIIRNFNGPLLQLTRLMRKVSEGELPRLEKARVKNEIDELSNYFSDMLQSLRDKQDEVDRTHEKLEQIAITDQLTGFYNRRHLLEVFPKLYAQAQRDEIGVFAFLLDIDHFKRINDTHGHLAGDRCLEVFSEVLQAITRKNDFLFRVGGEEFLVLTTGKNADDMVAIADKIRIAIGEAGIDFEGTEINITASCGVSCSRTDDKPEDALRQLLALADTALYEAKEGGRNQVCFSEACKSHAYSS